MSSYSRRMTLLRHKMKGTITVEELRELEAMPVPKSVKYNSDEERLAAIAAQNIAAVNRWKARKNRSKSVMTNMPRVVNKNIIPTANDIRKERIRRLSEARRQRLFDKYKEDDKELKLMHPEDRRRLEKWRMQRDEVSEKYEDYKNSGDCNTSILNELRVKKHNFFKRCAEFGTNADKAMYNDTYEEVYTYTDNRNYCIRD